MIAGRTLAAATVVGVAGEWGPMLTSIPHLRRAALPGMSGVSTRHHIALTYDDGPDPASTPLLSLIHISEPTRLGMISYAVFCLKKKKTSIPEKTKERDKKEEQKGDAATENRA